MRRDLLREARALFGEPDPVTDTLLVWLVLVWFGVLVILITDGIL